MARVVLVVIGLAAVGTTGIVALLAYDFWRSKPPRPQPLAIERLPPRQNHNPWARWSVTEHLSAHHVLIAHVETTFLDEAVAIAQQVGEPVKDQYAEILIYFHRPGRPDTLPPRRVQWTAARGYVETIYEVPGGR